MVGLQVPSLGLVGRISDRVGCREVVGFLDLVVFSEEKFVTIPNSVEKGWQRRSTLASVDEKDILS